MASGILFDLKLAISSIKSQEEELQCQRALINSRLFLCTLLFFLLLIKRSQTEEIETEEKAKSDRQESTTSRLTYEHVPYFILQ